MRAKQRREATAGCYPYVPGLGYAGLRRLIFTPRKGDVLIWHSALVHGGMPRNDSALTRKRIVSHYTTQEAYPYDRRCPDVRPIVRSRNGGIYYGSQQDGHVEARYAL